MRGDEELMSAVANGDLDAFEQLVRRHQASAWNVAFRLLRNAHDAEDVVQDAFLRVLRAAHRYQRTAAFRTYLYRIVTRLCQDRYRKVSPPTSCDLDTEASTTPPPADCLSVAEERQAVQQAIALLPVKQREAVVLRYYENLTYDEIGKVIGTSRKGVERLLARGRTTLAKRLGGFLEK